MWNEIVFGCISIFSSQVWMHVSDHSLHISFLYIDYTRLFSINFQAQSVHLLYMYSIFAIYRLKSDRVLYWAVSYPFFKPFFLYIKTF